MSIEVISIGSSSSGNSYIIRAGGCNIILDVGLTAKRIITALTDYDISPEDVDAVLVTHEHVDHVRSIRAISRKCSNALFLTSRGTYEHTENFKFVPEERLRIIPAGATEEIGGVSIKAFSLSHDASEPISYTMSFGGEKLGVVTDTGIITDEIYNEISDADMLVFESNHDEDLLLFGEYPYPLKMRIKGDHGHLSNRYAGEILAKIMTERHDKSLDERPLRIMLAHLSFHNNAPFYARSTVEAILKDNGFARNEDYDLTIAARDEICVM